MSHAGEKNFECIVEIRNQELEVKDKTSFIAF